MTTFITLDIAGDEPGCSRQIQVEEPFDRVLDLVVPSLQGDRSLLHRSNLILTAVGGGRLLVRPEHVLLIEEVSNG